MKISVIIPAYNAQKTILKTIQSVLWQTHSDWELIIINDASTDSTIDILQSLNDPRIRVFNYTNNAGANVCRNRGLAYASSDFVSFLDADDMWSPDKLESQLKALQRSSSAAVAYSWSACIDEQCNFVRQGCQVNATGFVYPKLLIANFLENGSNPLIRKDAIASIGGFDESLAAGQDWDMWLRLAQKFYFACVPTVQVYYRLSSQSLSTNIQRQEYYCLSVLEKSFAVTNEYLYLKPRSYANLYKYLIHKSLEYPLQKNCFYALKFLWLLPRYDQGILCSKIYLKTILKIFTILLMGSYSQNLINKFPFIYNTSTILGYLDLPKD